MANSFQFLEEIRIPALDGILSPENQSLGAEAIFWTLAYMAYAQVFSRVIRAVYRKSSIWTHAHKRGGVFCGNGRDDAVMLTVCGVHHISAAYVMCEFGCRGLIYDAFSRFTPVH